MRNMNHSNPRTLDGLRNGCKSRFRWKRAEYRAKYIARKQIVGLKCWRKASEMRNCKRMAQVNEDAKKIDDFNGCDQKHREILEQGINLLRYGFKEKDINDFIDACVANTDMA